MSVGAPFYAASAAAILALVAVVLTYRRGTPAPPPSDPAMIFDGWGEGDLRLDEPVPPGRVQTMVHEALENFGFSVVWTTIKATERVPRDDPGVGILHGRASVLFNEPDGGAYPKEDPPGWDSPVRFRINVADRHGAPDFNEMSVTAFIPPGWEDYRQ